MMLTILARTALAVALLQALPAQAQIGTPGNAPLYPGGPRQGLGPPSITDSVPDIRLRSDGNGIPGAGPPIDYGAGTRGSQPFGASGLGARPAYREPRQRQRHSRYCATPERTCTLSAARPRGADCTCRGRGAVRSRGHIL